MQFDYYGVCFVGFWFWNWFFYEVTPLLFPSIQQYKMRPKQQKYGANALNQISRTTSHIQIRSRNKTNAHLMSSFQKKVTRK